MVAESATAGIPLHLHDPQAQKIPWSQVPAPNQQALARGEPVGGPVDQVFASTPELLESLQRDGIRSVLFFPIHVDGRWWGYIGFDDTEPTREWDPQELLLLETAAGVLASFLLRGEKERSLARQHIYQRALSRCSRVLLRSAATKSERVDLLNEALAHLMEAVEASRAYIFQNRLDPLEGESMGALAESVAPGVVQHRSVPVNQNFPWAELPPEMYATLRDRRPFGGPVEYAMTSKPALKDAFLQQQPPLLSLQLFPIYLDDVWWGFIGFDDCLQPRIWDEGEIQLLRTGAEMISSVLLRWQREDSNLAQAQAQQALARSSQRLLQPAASAGERQAALAQALGFLVEAANASRGYLFKNFEHPQDGFSMQMLAEACDPGAEAHLGGPFAGHVPWDLLVPETRILLEQGQMTSGPVEQVLAGSPEIQDALDSDPALSVQLFPIYFGDRWWGMLGFDDFETLRAWGDQETMLLSTGAEIFSQTLQRWEAEDELQRTLNALEERVQQRTRQLLLANTRLMEEIEEREAAQHSLKNQLKLESGLAGISEGLMAATDLGTAINQGLAGLGELIQASRVSLILLAERQEFVITDVVSWQKPDIPAFSQEEAQVLTTTFSWSTSQLARHLPVYIHAAQDLPEEALHEWTYLQEKRTDSLLLFPLVAQNQLIGVLACENIGFTGELFADVRRMLEVAAGILSSALAHQQLLDDLELKINTRTRELAALYDLAILGGQSAQLSDILQPMLSRILEITSSEAACLHLLEGDTLRLEVHLGFTAGQMVRRKEILLSPAIKDWLAQADVLVANRPQAQAIPQPEIFSLADFAQMRLVRLSGRDQFHGILCCYRRENIPYSPHQSSTLAAIGEQLGMIIENHHLRMEAEALASLRERQRLARELHDSVSQSLYSLTLFARAGRDALESGDLETLAQSLLEVEENSKHALREMRLLLYQLRSEAIEEGLRQALEDRFQMIEHRLGIQTDLDFDSSLQLDPVIEQELFGLINEALNNAVKHASPSQVLVALKRSAAGLELLVADNGEGFTPQKASAGIGLSSMHERAELLGGALEIYSQPGEGTQVRLVLPAGRVETGG
jgi:signal transduction histidine kinase